ncbi:hypothetical protein RN001_013411 [Aquatica leii]|uniref:Regulatory protein zeste n=1 Tax=Aquatica leii TaxID=1421715 RepID=A0AAN7S713_9COLE|nr:hypothetical protein RN001_013411 [Aquatica leii]
MDQNEKKRCTNFTKNEIDILLELVDFHKDIVECKKTDCVSNAAKDAEWCKIAVKFNALCGTGRAARMLRNKWDSLKKTTKKEYLNIRMKTYKTGGGPFTDVKLTGVGNRVLALIGIAAKGTNSEFDCDAVDSDTTVHNTTANVTQSEVIGEWVEMENLETVTENVPMDAAIVIEGAEVLQTIRSFDPERVLQKIPNGDNVNDPDDSVNNILVNFLQQQRFTAGPSKRNIKKQRLAVESGTSVAATINADSSDSDVNEPIIDDNSDDDPPEDKNDDVSAEIKYFEPKDTEVVSGKFVLVKVYGGSRKKTIYRYIAIVQDVKENEGGVKEIELLGMKSLDKSRKVFGVQIDDEFVSDISDVLAILPNPAVQSDNGTDHYVFEKVIDTLEMK